MLIRGVALHTCLSGLGRHWRRPCFHNSGSEYDLSSRTLSYDFFFSHDWGTKGWLKFISLLVLFNSRAATLATLAYSLLAAAVVPQGMGMLPSHWLPVSGYLVFLFLVSWQHLRAAVRAPRTAFLDKLCIPQGDEELKASCIFRLSSFLDRSKSLVVLWSPQYFSRLWCMYEVATFLRDRRQQRSQSGKPVVFLPVQVSVLYLVTFVANSVLHFSTLSAAAAWRFQDQSLGAMARFILCNSSLPWIFLPACFWLCTDVLQDAAQLRDQILSFRIQDSMCFCCQHEHQHPETGVDIPCDRQLIYGVLQKWFGSSAHSQEECLDTFNRLVRTELAPPVLRKLEDETLMAQYLTTAGFASFFPWIPMLLPAWLTELRSACEGHAGYGKLLRSRGMEVNIVLVLLCCVHWRVKVIGPLGLRLRSRLSAAVTVAVQVLAELFLGLGSWSLFPVSVLLVHEDSLLPALPLCLLLLLNLVLYKGAAEEQGSGFPAGKRLRKSQ